MGFTPLEEHEAWHLKPSHSYFFQKEGCLIAFRLPIKHPRKILLIASHTDSPALKLKPQPEVVKENIVLLETERYGSPILRSWFNRDLGIAGRIFVESGDQIEERLIFVDETPVYIPELPPHLSKKGKEESLDLQLHLRAVLTTHSQKYSSLSSLLTAYAPHEKILSSDLFLVPLEPPRFLGTDSEMVASYRLDNLLSVHAALNALASSTLKESLQIAVFWDHEEIGSKTAEGAYSPLLNDVLKRICLSLKISEEDFLRLKSTSLAASVDVAHAFNPNFSDHFDPNHIPLMGKGIILKYNAERKYASDGKTAAYASQLAKKLKINLQSFTPHSNVGCGSTVGPIILQTLGIPTFDIGSGILSMHSIREVASCQDHLDLCHFLTHFLEL